MTYICPKCKNVMVAVSTASIPPITRYVCLGCGYESKPEKEILNYVELPLWLRPDEETDEDEPGETVQKVELTNECIHKISEAVALKLMGEDDGR